MMEILTVKAHCIIILPGIPDNFKGLCPMVSERTKNYVILPCFNTVLHRRRCHLMAIYESSLWTKHWQNYLFFNYLFILKDMNTDRQ